MNDKFIFASGGERKDGEALRSVERFDIIGDFWAEMPQMKVARYAHGSCTLATAVYVLCGWNGEWLNSVEKLETLNLVAGWLLIQIPPTSLTPRINQVVAALNSSQILIMGGMNREFLGDALTFDTQDDSVRMVIARAPYKFLAYETAAVQVKHGMVDALVIDNHRAKKMI